MWFLGSSPHIQLNTLQSLILLHFCSSSGTYKQPLLNETQVQVMNSNTKTPC